MGGERQARASLFLSAPLFPPFIELTWATSAGARPASATAAVAASQPPGGGGTGS